MGLLEGKIALVTGAGRGIGTSIARLFLSEGAKVAGTIHQSAGDAESLRADGLELFQSDLTDPKQAARVVDEVMTKFARVDILINTAASFTHGKTFEEDTWESYQHEMDGVFGATFHVTHALVPHMKAQGYGRIVNFGASLLWRPVTKYGPHASAKAAVVGLTGVLVRELGPFGITVNLIHPGMTMTDFSKSLSEDARTKVAEQTPLRRVADADDVAKVALFFASELAGFVSGAGLAPDGGLAVL